MERLVDEQSEVLHVEVVVVPLVVVVPEHWDTVVEVKLGTLVSISIFLLHFYRALKLTRFPNGVIQRQCYVMVLGVAAVLGFIGITIWGHFS